MMLIPSILLVEDDEIDAEMIRRAFRQHKLANPLIHVTDGRSALELLRGKPGVDPLPKPYMILLDMNMPGMNGQEFLRELRQDPKLTHSLVFVLTTSINPHDKLFACKKQIAGYILKQNVGQYFGSAFHLLDNYQRPVVPSEQS
ncbi:response regulator [soil metagenome]